MKAAKAQGVSKSVNKPGGPKVKVTKINEGITKKSVETGKVKTGASKSRVAAMQKQDDDRPTLRKNEGIGNLIKKGAKAAGGAVVNRLTTTGRAKIAQKKIDKHNTKVQQKDTIAKANAAGKSAFGLTQKSRAANAKKKLDKIAKKKAALDTIQRAKDLKKKPVQEISSNKLGDYMRKSSSDAAKPGQSARTQDKRIGGQSMADKKIRKKMGYSSTAKVPAGKNEAKQTHMFDNEKDARAKAKEIGGKYVKGTGKSAGKHAAISEGKKNKAKQTHMFDNEKAARAKAKEIGGKYVKGIGKSAGKHAAILEGKKMDSAAMKRAMDAFKKRGGKVTKVAPGKAAGYHGKDDPGKDVQGMMDRGDTKGFNRKKKVKSMR